jgi:hypothetical protein
MEAPPPRPIASRTLVWLPIGLAFAANLVTAGLSLKFYWVPAGIHVQIAGWAGSCGLVSLASIGVVLPTAIFAMMRCRTIVIQFLAILVSVLPFPVALGILHHAAEFKGFILPP